MIRTKKTLALCIALVLLVACKKDFLEVKSDKKLVVPSSAKDLQALLDNTTAMNSQGDPSLGELGADDYFLTDARWETMSMAYQRNAYVWARDIFESETFTVDWNRPYQMVFYANTVLEGASKLADVSAASQLRGQALFARSWAFYGLLQVFAAPYNPAETNQGPGIPLRLESDINLPSSRATIVQCYQMVIADLAEAIPLLPDLPLVKTRASKVAALALLARVNLLMGSYEKGLDFSSRALALQSSLIDYNTLSASAANPFMILNQEVIYHSELAHAASFGNTRLNVVPEVYNAYAADDLRKSLFFFNNAGTLAFKGSYSTLPYFFSGLAVDEMMLVKAECLARLSKGSEALDVLGALLSKRWKTGRFVAPVPAAGQTVLELVLLERRNELIFRGLRWPDLRRLNMDPALKKDLVRVVKGQAYNLPAGDGRYVYPLPNEVLRLTDMPNNSR